MTKWTNEEISNLIDICNNVESTSDEIFIHFPTKSKSAVFNKISRLGLKYKKKKNKWTEMDKIFLRDNYKTGDKVYLLNGLDHTFNSIKNMAVKMNLSFPDEKVIGTNKERLSNLLLDIPEAFYWIGFIMADGCIHNDYLSLEISKSDSMHLQRFVDFIGSGEIRYRRNNCVIAYNDKCNIPMIRNKFDIKNRKTYNPPSLDIFNSINSDLLFCLFIGFIDGDGHIKKNGRQITLENHETWAEFHKLFIDFISETFNTKVKSKQRYNNRGYSCITISDSYILHKIKFKLMDFSLPLLQRKWDRINLNIETKKEKYQ